MSWKKTNPFHCRHGTCFVAGVQCKHCNLIKLSQRMHQNIQYFMLKNYQTREFAFVASCSILSWKCQQNDDKMLWHFGFVVPFSKTCIDLWWLTNFCTWVTCHLCVSCNTTWLMTSLFHSRFLTNSSEKLWIPFLEAELKIYIY